MLESVPKMMAGYSGPFNAEYTLVTFCGGPAGGGNTCKRILAISGTATVTLEEESGGSLKDVSGLQLTGTQVDVRITGGCNPIGPTQFVRSCRLSGPAGAFAGGALTGNVTLDDSAQSPDDVCPTYNSTGSARFPLSLR